MTTSVAKVHNNKRHNHKSNSNSNTISQHNNNNNSNSTNSNNNNDDNNNNYNNSSNNDQPIEVPAIANMHGNHSQQLHQQQQQHQQHPPLPMSLPILTAPTTTNHQHNSSTAATILSTRAMQSDEDFNIRFVNLVRAHKCLYDKKVPEYRNRDNQEKAWSLISQETKENVIHCKERWRNLRACLSRYIKQQSSSDPQHKPYYLTEHMAFLLPFLKSIRASTDSNIGASNRLSTLFQISQHMQQHPSVHSSSGMMLNSAGSVHLLSQQQLYNDHHMELKHSLSENDDEETIDAFDPAVTASIQMHRANNGIRSSPMSDTASANTMQNFIPDVQLAELNTSDGAPDISFVTGTHNHIGVVSTVNNGHRESLDFSSHDPKRIKTECHASEATTTAQLHNYCTENTDMEFFRSILPDIAALTPQQKRKFKIGILELIDDVTDRYPTERSIMSNSCSSKQRRYSSRDWRK